MKQFEILHCDFTTWVGISFSPLLLAGERKLLIEEELLDIAF